MIAVASGADEREWDAYVAQHPDATADHLWGWRRVFEGVFSHECVYLIARRDAAVVGVLPLVLFRSRLFGRFIVSLPFLNDGGLLTDDADAAAALVHEAGQVAQRFRASHVELRHRHRQLVDRPFRSHKLGLSRTLPATVDALWTETDRKVRNLVRKAQKSSLTVADGGLELVDEFYQVFARNMRDLGTPVYSKRLFTETLRSFPDRARIVVVRLGSAPIAGAVAITFRQTVVVPWASSLREFRQLSPNMLLYWTLLERATSEGMRTFDFGRSSPGGGTHQFKLQWGASEVPLHWEYLLLTRDAPPDQGPGNARFSAVIEAWKRLPLGLANRLGPRIVRNIP